MTLRLTALALSHFRSHRRTRLTFEAPVVAIHGANGSGKTNLLEAISLLSPGRGMRRAEAAEIVRRPEAIGWRIEAALAPDHEVELRAEPGEPRTTRIDGKSAPQIALARLTRVLWLVPSMDRLWLEGAEGRRRFLDRTVLSLDPSHGEDALRYEKAMRDRNRLLRDDVRDARWFEALEAQMAEAGAGMSARRRTAIRRLSDAQSDGDGPFPAAELALAEQGAQDAPEALARALADSRPRDRMAGRTLVGPHRTDLIARYAAKRIEARLCSTGEQKALLISLVLANARAIREDTGAAPILLLDEVAAHLDADRRAALYAELSALGGQCFLTGTGPELFKGIEAQRLAVREAAGESVVDAA